MERAAGLSFQEREARFAAAVRLEVPDRVPLEIAYGYFPARYCGVRPDAAYYDYETWLAACLATVAAFGADMSSVQPFFPGEVLEMIEPQALRWPGGRGAEIRSHQVLDGEYMRDSEYPALIADPTSFLLTRYLPRATGALRGFACLPPLPCADAGYRGVLCLAEALLEPEVAAALERLKDIGEVFARWRPRLAAFDQELENAGFPLLADRVVLAPYDIIADNLRGMRGIMTDLFKHPDELQQACAALLRVILDRLGWPVEGRSNRVLIPLHFGSAGFCSLEQFETFYWPTLRQMIVAMVQRGFTPLVMTEGDYTSRLEYLLELPRGKVFVHFDATDVFRAKDVLGGHLCISGNVPVTLLAAGTPEEVRAVAKELIDYCGRDGGFVMSTRCPVDDVRPENLRALVDFTVQYGVYV